MDKKRRAIGIYIRVLTKKPAGQGYSLEEQRKEAIQEAYKLYGDNIDLRFYVDEENCAKSTYRKELNRMMHDIEIGDLDAVITNKLSQLSRNLSDSLSLVEKMHGENVNFISVTEGEYNPYQVVL